MSDWEKEYLSETFVGQSGLFGGQGVPSPRGRVWCWEDVGSPVQTNPRADFSPGVRTTLGLVALWRALGLGEVKQEEIFLFPQALCHFYSA